MIPGRYRVCERCVTPEPVHDPECPGFRSGSTSEWSAEALKQCRADLSGEPRPIATAERAHWKAAQGTLL
jgi:hypothetical protein